MELGDAAVRSIVAHLARLRAEHGDAFAAPDLVEPTGEYFPDAFALEPKAIHRLVLRMATYAPIVDGLDLALGFIEDDDAEKSGGCGSGACGDETSGRAPVHGTALETQDGYAVLVHVGVAGEPKLLTASIARALGRVVLFEADEDVPREDDGPAAELTAVASGFGLILLGGACVYKKGCGGMRRQQGTHLSVSQVALALALFVRVTGTSPGRVKRHLEITQKEAFADALAWVDEHPRLVKSLTDAPHTLTDGVFEREGKKGFLSRLLTRKTSDDDEPNHEIAAKAQARSLARSEEERKRIAETRALVEEALQD